MPDHADLVPVGAQRAALTGVQLPSPPPTRIYISGYEYRVQAPRLPLPPVANAIKLIVNYALAGGRIANNILHLLTGGGVVTSSPLTLQDVANKVFAAITTGGGAVPNMLGTTTKINSVTAKDMGGTTATATSTSAPVSGVATGGVHPPQVAICVSWQIAESYRGGKPRTYVPTPPVSCNVSSGSASLDPAFATMVDSTWTAALNAINAIVPTGGGTVTLGTYSYYHGHALRPTPLFRTFTTVRVHERLDSQRRRSGPESIYLVTP